MRWFTVVVVVLPFLVAVLTPLAVSAKDLVAMADVDAELSDLYGDEAFITIATGSSKPVSRAPAVASLITARDIEEMGARTVMEALESVPGLHVSLSNLNRTRPIYSIRGIHTGHNPHVLFLLNGLPFPFSWSGGTPNLFRFPLENVSRIEVLRGPGSAIYGADAFSGVINIITKQGNEIDGVDVGARLGSFDNRDAWLQVGQEWGELEGSFSLEWRQTDGDDGRIVKSDFQSILDQMTGTDASLAPGPLSTRYKMLNSHLDLRYDDVDFRLWHWQLMDAGQGAGAAQALDPVGRQDDSIWRADLLWNNNDLVENFEFDTVLSYMHLDDDTEFVILPPGTAGFEDGMVGQPRGIIRYFEGRFSAAWSGFTDHRLLFGTGFQHQEMEAGEKKNFGPGAIDGQLTDVSGTPYVYIQNQNRDLWYLIFQDEWLITADWELTAGLRYDRYSDFGSTLNPRLALVWNARHDLTAKILYGRAFRAPSFAEFYADQNPIALGNKSLDPEVIDTGELVFDYRPTFDLQLVASLFYYKIDGLIDTVPDLGADTATAKNARDQEGYGGEVEINWDATDDLRLSGNYAYQHSINEKTDRAVPDAPRQQLYLGAHYTFLGNGSIHPTVNWVMDRARFPGDSRDEIDDYVLVDLTLRWKNLFVRNLDVALAGRNLFDEDAREPSTERIPDDYPLEGRSFWGEVSFRF